MWNKRIIFLLLIAFLCSVADAQLRKKIYIAPDDHTDYMWTGDEEAYKDAILTMLDYYMNLNDSTAHEPYHIQNKWNCDGSYWLYLYSINRSEEQLARLIQQIKDEKITVPMNTLISLMGVAPLEATLRDMYYAGSMQRKYGIDFPLVLSMEDQVLPLGLASLWAGSGAKYSWRGVCACATQVKGFQYRPHEIYWYTGLDDQRVMMKWYSINPAYFEKPKQYQYNLGKYGEGGDHIGNAILECEELLQLGSHYPYHIAAAFGKGGDNLKTLTDEYPRVAREASNDEYEIIVSNELDFFREMEQNYGKRLPSESLSYGTTEWGLAVASMADLSAKVKRAVEKLRSAELMYSLVALRDTLFAKDLEEMRRQAWFACGLYYEHDWTADGPNITRKQRADWQRKVANRLTAYVDTLYQRSFERLKTYIAGGQDCFFVLNPLGWMRTDYCDFDYQGNEPVCVIDEQTGLPTPSQCIEQDGQRKLRILAKDVPSLGYKTYRVVQASDSLVVQTPFLCQDEWLENETYRLRLNKQGAITSLIDKRNGYRECVKVIDGKCLNDLGKGSAWIKAKGAPIRFENVGPVSATIVAESYYPVKHTTRVTMFQGIDRIEIENLIEENYGNDMQMYAYAFNIDNPYVRTEESGAILDVRQASQGGHYADNICRLDWVALNHFADISGRQGGVVLSNRDAYFMKTGHSTIDSLDVETPLLTVLSGGKVLKDLGIDYQDGVSRFDNHFSLLPYTGQYDAIRSMRTSLEHSNPLVSGHALGDGTVFDNNFSLFTVSNDQVIPWTVKPAEEGIENGIIIRLWNLSDNMQTFSLNTSLPLSTVQQTTHIETDVQDVRVNAGTIVQRLAGRCMKTYRLNILGE